ncbi:MAG: nucleotidyltransferase domain-containing protein [Bdellovibrionota bacterium]
MSENQDSGLSLENVDQLKQIFKKYPTIQKVVLYGSRAKGNYKPASDIDLTMFTAETDLSFLFKVENEIDDLLLPYKVDLSIYSLLDNDQLKDHINRVGKVFYVHG